MVKYKRVLLKLSGEGLMGEKSFGLDEAKLSEMAQEIKQVHDAGVQLAIVIGGGNIFRGLKGAAGGMDRVRADHMGMLATVINSLAMQDALQRAGVPARVVSGVVMPTICEPYVQPRVKKKLEEGNVVILPQGRAIRSLRRTRARLCAPPKWAVKRFSKPHRLTACIPPIRKRIKMLYALKKSAMMKCWSKI